MDGIFPSEFILCKAKLLSEKLMSSWNVVILL